MVSLSQFTEKLGQRMKELFLGSNAEDRADRLDLLDKTGEYADLQAKLATNISQENHLVSEISNLELQIFDLEAQISSNKDPIKELENL